MSSDSEVPVISFGSSNTTIGRPTPDPDSTDESDIGDMANTTAGLISNDSTVDENMPPIWPHGNLHQGEKCLHITFIRKSDL